MKRRRDAKKGGNNESEREKRLLISLSYPSHLRYWFGMCCNNFSHGQLKYSSGCVWYSFNHTFASGQMLQLPMKGCKTS